MRIKSYFANSVDAAIRQAREELGPEAMVIDSRAPSGEMRRRGRVEVVIGVMDSAGEDRKSREIATSSGREDLAAELKMLRDQVDDLRKMMQPPSPVPQEVDRIRQELIAAEIDPEIVERIVEVAEVIWQKSVAHVPGARQESLRQIVQDCLRNGIQTAHEVNCSADRGNVIALVGPPGAGKTTALAKIAVQHCLAKRRSVRIISVDTDRVGGHELLRSYSNVLGIGFIAVNSLADLHDALNQPPEKACVLIDTPGFARADMGAAQDLATILERIAGREVHLVLPASMKRVDAEAYSDHFVAIFQPARLLFTKLDETASVGSMLSETLRLKLPLSFFSLGQGVPEDLENADPEALIGHVLPATAAAAANAA